MDPLSLNCIKEILQLFQDKLKVSHTLLRKFLLKKTKHSTNQMLKDLLIFIKKNFAKTNSYSIFVDTSLYQGGHQASDLF